MKTITEDEYNDACRNNEGWCTECEDFTTVEPDAEGYECNVCGEYKVMGAEDAMMSGAFELE